MNEEEKEEIEIMLEDMFFWQGKSSFITRHRYKELSKKMYKEIDKLQKRVDELDKENQRQAELLSNIHNKYRKGIDKLQKVIDLMAEEIFDANIFWQLKCAFEDVEKEKSIDYIKKYYFKKVEEEK